METGHVRASPIELTTRQLAWLKELGVVKPWLPGSVTQTPVSRTSANQSPVSQISASESPVSPAASIQKHLQQSSVERPPITRTPAKRQPVTQTVADPVGAAVDAVVSPLSDVGASDLQELENRIRQCESCGLCRERTHAVPGQGVVRPNIMVVGEAPGEQEDRQGLPFVGRSGQLLDNMLAAIAHRRDTNLYITNVVKCRPPGNRNPDAQEIASCSSYLMRQIELIQPRAILAMGRFAAQTLLKREASMQALRGTVHLMDLADRQIPVVATYHPAYLLRRPVEKASAWQDLKRIEALVARELS